MRYYEFIILLAQHGDASNFYFKVSHHHLGNVNCGCWFQFLGGKKEESDRFIRAVVSANRSQPCAYKDIPFIWFTPSHTCSETAEPHTI